MSEEQKNQQPEAEQPEPQKANPIDDFVEHQKRAVEETGKAIESLLPPDFVKHAKEAQKEFLAGIKVLADTVIDEMEKVAKKVEEAKSESSDDEDKPSTTGKTKVKVQVE